MYMLNGILAHGLLFFCVDAYCGKCHLCQFHVWCTRLRSIKMMLTTLASSDLFTARDTWCESQDRYVRSLILVCYENIKPHFIWHKCHTNKSPSNFPSTDTQVEACVTVCLADILEWVSRQHLKLSLGQDWACENAHTKPCPSQWRQYQVMSTQIARNLGVPMNDDPWLWAKMAWSHYLKRRINTQSPCSLESSLVVDYRTAKGAISKP